MPFLQYSLHLQATPLHMPEDSNVLVVPYTSTAQWLFIYFTFTLKNLRSAHPVHLCGLYASEKEQ